MSGVTDKAIIYQLEKVDQGGDVQDLFEARMEYLAEQWGFEIEEDADSPNVGDIKLPDGRHAGLTFEAYIE